MINLMVGESSKKTHNLRGSKKEEKETPFVSPIS